MLDRLRVFIAALSTVGAAVLLGASLHKGGGIVAVVALLALSMVLMFHRHVVSQVWVRGTLWAHLIFAAGGSGFGSDDTILTATASVVLLALAIVFLGRHGLSADDPAGSFKPVAFRGTFLVGAVVSICLAEWISVLSVAAAEDGNIELLWLMLSAGGIFLSLVGLYRLELWGLLLKALIDVAFVALTAAVVSVKWHGVSVAFLGLAIFQLGLSLPVWVAVLRHKPSQRSMPGLAVQSLAAIGALALAVMCLGYNADAIRAALAAFADG